jgi:hypothetical protein
LTLFGKILLYLLLYFEKELFVEKEELSFAEIMKGFAEIRQTLKESAARHEKDNLAWRKRSDKLDRQLGYLGRSLGDVVELVVVPGMRKKMNSLGHKFTRIGPNTIFDKNDKTLTEVDLLLENGEESMAVEIKTDLSVKWVEKHLKRLKLLRKNENITGLKGKVLYAAVAGISIDKDARKLALENGMYVIDLIENEDRLEVTEPEDGKVGKW